MALQSALEQIQPGIRSGVWEAAIVERHHRHKIDEPSGTAKALAQTLWEGSDQVDIRSIRQGDTVGEHQVFLSGDGEELVITHRVTDRRVFARGATLAAEFAYRSPVGVWSMADVLGMQAPGSP